MFLTMLCLLELVSMELLAGCCCCRTHRGVLLGIAAALLPLYLGLTSIGLELFLPFDSIEFEIFISLQPWSLLWKLMLLPSRLC